MLFANESENGRVRASARLRATSSVIVTAVLVCTTVAVSYLIYTTIKSKGKPSDLRVMILKQAFSHLQVVSMVALFPLQWPDILVSLFSSFQIASASGEKALAVDCVFRKFDSFASPVYAVACAICALPPPPPPHDPRPLQPGGRRRPRRARPASRSMPGALTTRSAGIRVAW